MIKENDGVEAAHIFMPMRRKINPLLGREYLPYEATADEMARELLVLID